MTEKMNETLERTEKALLCHLNVLDEEVESVDGHVENHMTIDGIKDVVKSLKDIKKIRWMCWQMDAGKQPATAAAAK